jgi:hypothetical protein
LPRSSRDGDRRERHRHSDKIAFKTGANASTPSGNFIAVPGASTTVTATADSPLVVRFSAVGSVRDLNSCGGFAGHKFAAMLVRVLVNDVQVALPLGRRKAGLAVLFGVPASLVHEALEKREVLPCLGMPENADGKAP